MIVLAVLVHNISNAHHHYSPSDADPSRNVDSLRGRYTQGYVVMSEIVFLLKGLTRLKPSDRNVPIISIQKMANDFKYVVWVVAILIR